MIHKILLSLLLINSSSYAMDHNARQSKIAEICDFLELWVHQVRTFSHKPLHMSHRCLPHKAQKFMEEKKKILVQLYCLQNIVGRFMNYQYLEGLSLERFQTQTTEFASYLSHNDLYADENLISTEFYGKEKQYLSEEEKGKLLLQAWPKKEQSLNAQLKALYTTHVDSFKTSLLSEH